MSEHPVWIVMPVMAGPEMTEAAIGDCLHQSIPTRLLIVNQAVETPFRERLERLAEEYSDRIFVWSHEPTLRSLSATWNRALDFVWACGGQEALVVNNDVRLHSSTVRFLSDALHQTNALFVSAVGVHEESQLGFGLDLTDIAAQRGGPDFSCFLISKEGHEKYRFDEHFVPAFCEDLDAHRRYMLGGDGHKIFSVNLPYLHLGSQTLKTVDPNQKRRIERSIEQGSRAYYLKKWGGPVNEETFYYPFNDTEKILPHQTGIWERRCGPTTPEIQHFQQQETT